MTQKSDKEYDKERLNEYYKENVIFLNKAILGISSLALPLIFNAVPEANGFCEKILLFSLAVGFILVIIFEIIASEYAKMGCDKALDNNKEHKADFESADKFDWWKRFIFKLSLVLIAATFFLKMFEI